MADSFDPYHKWLGISPKDQPPNHYRLLAIEPFESDPDVIEGAADRLMAHLRTFQSGPHSAHSQKLLNECAAARVTLLDPQKRAEYDRQLRLKLASSVAPSGAVSPARPHSVSPKPAVTPVARPLPQAAPIRTAQAAPASIVDEEAAATPIHRRATRQTPIWRQPAVLGTVGALAIFAGIAYALNRGEKRPADVAGPSPADTVHTADAVPPGSQQAHSPAADKSGTGPVVSPAQPPAEVLPEADFEILSANWGAGDKWADVTEGVRGLVKDNRLMMIVWSDLFGKPADAPAGPGNKLRLRYRSRGKEYTAEYFDSWFVYLDGNPLSPPADSPGALELLEARYGAGGTFVDVLPQLQPQLHDGRLSVCADDFAAANSAELEKHGIGGNIFKVLWVRYRSHTGEHFTYAWNSQPLTIDTRSPKAAGPPVNLLRLIDVPRHVVYGDWSLREGRLLAPPQVAARVQIPYRVPSDYALNVVVESDGQLAEVGAGLVVGPRQVLATVDSGGELAFSGLALIDGLWHSDDKNPTQTWRLARMLEQGRANTLTYVVRPTSVRVLRDGAEIVRWSGNPASFSLPETWEVPDPRRLYLQSYNVAYRISGVELTPLVPETSPMVALDDSGFPADVLQAIELDRDRLHGDWQHDDQTLVSPATGLGTLQLPCVVPENYQLDMVAQRESGNECLTVTVPIAGAQGTLVIDGYEGKLCGLQTIDGRRIDSNETRHEGAMFADGKRHLIRLAVQKNHVRLVFDGKPLVDWTGDVGRLKPSESFPYNDRIYLGAWQSRYRLTQIKLRSLHGDGGERAALAGQANQPPAEQNMPERPGPAAPASTNPATGLLKIFEDEADFVQALNAGNGAAVLAKKESYSGKTSVRVTGEQRFREQLPGLNVKIRREPQASDEYRYLRFAWKKRGGKEIFLQLHYPNNWFRYCAGSAGAYMPAISLSRQVPKEFVVVTRDLAADFGEFNLTGIALSPVDGEWACFDHIYLARNLSDFGSIETRPNDKPEQHKLADLASGKETRLPVPEDEAQKEARKEMQKKLGTALKGAKTPEQKRALAQELAQKAVVGDDKGAYAYALLTQAIDLAEAAGEIELAWRTSDQLANTFQVDGMALRNRSLAEIGKSVKSPDRAWQLTDAACRLMVAALLAGDAATVKKAASQAQSFAKRTNDRAVQKEVNSRATDASKLAADLEAVAAARETLKASPGDPQANFTVGYFELCAAGDFNAALPKLAKAGDETWTKLANDELSLSGGQPGDRELALGDAWWSRADEAPWPGKHHLRMRAAKWYASAYRSLLDAGRLRAAERLKMLLATDDGFPHWELFNQRSLRGADLSGEVVRLEGGGLETSVDYIGPVEATLVVRTTGTDFRLNSHHWGWGWNFKLLPNQWHTLRFLITPISKTAFVDGVPLDNETWQTPRKFNPGPVSVYVNSGDIAEIRKFIVKTID